MLGAKSIHADECFKGNFIGAASLLNIIPIPFYKEMNQMVAIILKK